MKVVINRCFGGFNLSDAAKVLLPNLDVYDCARSEPELVRVVQELGSKAWGAYARLAVVEIPDDVSWYIHEYDGMEYVAENHRTWS